MLLISIWKTAFAQGENCLLYTSCLMLAGFFKYLKKEEFDK